MSLREHRRARARAARPQSQSPSREIHPRGPQPGNGASRRIRRVDEVVRRQATEPGIAVRSAVGPTQRSPRHPRRVLTPTDGSAPLIHDGFSRLDARLVEILQTLRQASGLDEADEELDELRRENDKLKHDLHVAQQQIQAMQAQVQGDGIAPMQLRVEDADVAPEDEGDDDEPDQAG